MLIVTFFGLSLKYEDPIEDPDAFFDGSRYGKSMQLFDAGSQRSSRAQSLGGGSFLTTVGTGVDRARGVLFDAYGAMVLGGVSNNADLDFALARYHADGELDTSFHTDGKAMDTMGSADDWLHGVVRQTDGKYVAVGRGKFNNIDFVVARYVSEGVLDTTFHTDGKVATEFYDNTDIARAVLLQTDGKLVVGGFSWLLGKYLFAVARYLTNGVLDTSFNSQGKKGVFMSSSHSGILALTLQPDGSILATGTASNGADFDFAVARFTTAGSLDTSFSADGMATTPILANDDKAYGIAVSASGLITVSGSADNGADLDFASVRYLSSGAIDTAFHTDGKQTTDVTATREDVAYAVGVYPNEKAVLGGYSYNGSNNDFALARYLPDGTLDTSFYTDGSVTHALGAQEDTGLNLTLSSEGLLLIAGQSHNGADLDFALARIQDNGALALSGSTALAFGTAGSLSVNFTGVDAGRAIAVDSTGRILVAGSLSFADFGVARMSRGGTLDTSFHTDGKVTFDKGGTETLRSLGIQTDGNILTGGDSDGTAILVRLLTDGGVDTTFHTDGVVDHVGTTTGEWFVLQTDAKIVAGGGTVDFALVRIEADGILDTSFHTDGKLIQDIDGNDDSDHALIQTDGKIVVMGGGSNKSHLIRVLADGSLDTAFNTTGKIGTQYTGGAELWKTASKIAERTESGAIAVVMLQNSGSIPHYAFRLSPDGSLDTSFFTAGKRALQDASTATFPASVHHTRNGKEIITNIDSSPGVYRLLSDGAYDTTFGTAGYVSTPITNNYSTLLDNGLICAHNSASNIFYTYCLWQ